MERRISFSNDNTLTDRQLCSICYVSLTELNNDISTTKCNHLFCTTCIIKSMKFNNSCPLCRTVLTSPNKKFSINYGKSKRIVLEEVQYYREYIADNMNYIMSTVEYHTENKSLTPAIKSQLQREMSEVFENFGMGICLNVNTKFANCNIYDTNQEIQQPSSPLVSPPNVENLINGVRLPPIS